MIAQKYKDLHCLPDSYHQLFEHGAQEWYDYSLAWFQNFAQTALDDGDQICIYGVESDNGSHEALAALATRYRASKGILDPAQLSSLSNFYTITFSPIVKLSEPSSRKTVQTLVTAISTDTPRWDVIDLRPLDPDTSLYSQLVDSFRQAGMVVQTYFCFGNWYLPVKSLSFEKYYQTLPSTMQNTIRRKTKKLEKTGRSRIEIITGGAGLEQAINAYERIYLSSWKRPEPYPEFVAGLIRTFSARNWLRMGVIYLDEEPIAAQVWIVNSSKATIYKLAHDQRFDDYSAGSILTTRLIQHVLDVDGVHEIDFGSGDDPYKKNWLPQRRERWGILAMNPRSLAGCIGIVRHVGGHGLKSAFHLLKKWLPKRNPMLKPAAERPH